MKTDLLFLPLFFLQSVQSSSHDKVDFDQWTNGIFEKQDKERSQKVWNKDFQASNDVEKIRDFFYKMSSATLQKGCHVIKKISGRWNDWCGFTDGEKLLCMDGFYEAVNNKTCLVYSFGLSDDWDFEEAMAELGCTVRAFDPTVTRPEHVKSPNIHFEKVGFGAKSEVTPLKKYIVKTLDEIVEENGDSDKEITYLKLDVEGAELEGLPQMIKSGVLENVRQIGIEMHTGSTVVHLGTVQRFIGPLIQEFQRLHNDLGFRLVAYNPNNCVGKNLDPLKHYYNYFDLLFYKPEVKIY